MATRYSYPMDLHKEPEGGYSVNRHDGVRITAMGRVL